MNILLRGLCKLPTKPQWTEMHPIIFLKNTWIYLFLILHAVVPWKRNECNPSTWVGRGRDKLYKLRPYLSAVVFFSFILKMAKLLNISSCVRAQTLPRIQNHMHLTHKVRVMKSEWGWKLPMTEGDERDKTEFQNYDKINLNQTLVLSGVFNTTESTVEVFMFCSVFLTRVKLTLICLKLHCSELIVKTTT